MKLQKFVVKKVVLYYQDICGYFDCLLCRRSHAYCVCHIHTPISCVVVPVGVDEDVLDAYVLLGTLMSVDVVVTQGNTPFSGTAQNTHWEANW